MASQVKTKTVKSAAKRFRATRRGKVKRYRAYRRHLMAGKNAKQRRRLRRVATVRGRQRLTVLRALGER